MLLVSGRVILFDGPSSKTIQNLSRLLRSPEPHRGAAIAQMVKSCGRKFAKKHVCFQLPNQALGVESSLFWCHFTFETSNFFLNPTTTLLEDEKYIHSLKLTCSPLKIGQRETKSLPTIHVQVRLLLVPERRYIYIYIYTYIYHI